MLFSNRTTPGRFRGSLVQVGLPFDALDGGEDLRAHTPTGKLHTFQYFSNLWAAEVNAIGCLALNMIDNRQEQIAASDAYQLVFQALVSHIGNVSTAEVSSRDLLDQLRGRASILLEVAGDTSGDGVLSFTHDHSWNTLPQAI
jgi:hypothetical protein